MIDSPSLQEQKTQALEKLTALGREAEEHIRHQPQRRFGTDRKWLIYFVAGIQSTRAEIEEIGRKLNGGSLI